MTSLNVLVLCDYHTPGASANALADHINAFARFSRNNVFCYSNLGSFQDELDLELFDVIVIHYSLYLLGPNYLSESAKERIRRFSGLKVQFIQDEYRTLNAFQSEIDRLGINLLFTCVPPALWNVVYPKHVLPNLQLRPTLTGYVPERLLAVPRKPTAAREVDVFYRGRQVPFWLGRAAQEKDTIATDFSSRAAGSGLVLDTASSERSRVYGAEWIARLSNAKCTLGVESAASILDFTGAVQMRCEEYMQRHPQAAYDEVERNVFPGIDGKFNTAQISPRCFEAAVLKTCMVLFEGHYSGILQPWRHYVPLKKDLSNFDEVLAAIKDPVVLQRIADCAFDEVAMNALYSFAAFIEGFDDHVQQEFDSKGLRRKSAPRSPEGLFGRLYTNHRAEHGRLHGPLYYSNKVDNRFVANRVFVEICALDFDVNAVAGTLTIREAVRQSSTTKVADSMREELAPALLNVMAFFWRHLPLNWRHRLRPALKFIRR